MKPSAFVCASILLAISPVVRAETHQFIPSVFYTTYSFAHPPALRIKPGDRVVTKTIDAGGRRLERQDRVAPAARTRRPGRSSSKAPSRAT